jgi:hypothetical protein
MLGDNTRRCSPGDIVNITGIFLPVPISGFRAMRAGALGVVSDTCGFPQLLLFLFAPHRITFCVLALERA